MITQLEQNFLYCCPECTAVTISKLNYFQLSAKKPYQLYCSDKGCLQKTCLIRAKKNNYEINVDCPICGDIHVYNISKKTLWNKDFLILNCQYSGFGILFIGKDTERLKSEYSAQNELIAGFLAENDEDYENYDLMFELLEILNSFVINHAIKCKCSSNNIKINVELGFVELVCLKCGNKKIFTADSDTISMLETLESITLD